MPSWVALIINRNDVDLNPPAGKSVYQQPAADQLLEAVEKAAVDGRSALSGTTDDFLVNTNWQLLVSGKGRQRWRITVAS